MRGGGGVSCLWVVLAVCTGTVGLVCPHKGARRPAGATLHHSRHGVDSRYWWTPEEVEARTLGKTEVLRPHTEQTHTRHLDVEVTYATSDVYTCTAVGATVRTWGNATYTCTDADVFTARKRIIIDHVVKHALRRIKLAVTALHVGGLENLIKLAGKPQCKAPFDSFSHAKLSGGLDQDLLLFVTAVPVKAGEGQIAFGYPCHFAPATHRPVIAHVNLDPSQVFHGSDEEDYLSNVVLHELVHALGWTPSLAQARQGSGDSFFVSWAQDYASLSPLRVRDLLRLHQRPTQAGSAEYFPTLNNTVPSSVVMMATPQVLEQARLHFDCELFGTQALPGLEVEDWTYGKSRDTPITVHWEKRITSGEVMNSLVERGAALSRLTLAALQDTGYYLANYAAAEPLSYGKGAGCGFVARSCLQWQDEPRTARYACYENHFLSCKLVGRCEKQCSVESTHRAACSATEHNTPMPPQYLHNSLYTGNRPLISLDNELDMRTYGCDPLMDHCMVWRTENDADSCLLPREANQPDCTTSPCDPFSIRGRGSACFSGSLRMTEFDLGGDAPVSGHCLPYTCRLEESGAHWELHVAVGERTKVCGRHNIGEQVGPFDSETPLAEGYFTAGGTLQGHIVCPDPAVLCTMNIGSEPELEWVGPDGKPSPSTLVAGVTTNVHVKLSLEGGAPPGASTPVLACLVSGNASALEISNGFWRKEEETTCVGTVLKSFDTAAGCHRWCATIDGCQACVGTECRPGTCAGVCKFDALDSCRGRAASKCPLWTRSRDYRSVVSNDARLLGCKAVYGANTDRNFATFSLRYPAGSRPALRFRFLVDGSPRSLEREIHVVPSKPVGLAFINKPERGIVGNGVPFSISAQLVDKDGNAVGYPADKLTKCPSWLDAERVVVRNARCYVYSDVPESFEGAREVCLASGGALAAVTDASVETLFRTKRMRAWAGVEVLGRAGPGTPLPLVASSGASLDFFNSRWNTADEPCCGGVATAGDDRPCIDFDAAEPRTPFRAAACGQRRTFWCEYAAHSTVSLSGSVDATLTAEPVQIGASGLATFAVSLQYSATDACGTYTPSEVEIVASDEGTGLSTTPLRLRFPDSAPDHLVICSQTAPESFVAGSTVSLTMNSVAVDGSFRPSAVGINSALVSTTDPDQPRKAATCYTTAPNSCVVSFILPTTAGRVVVKAVAPPLGGADFVIDVVAGAAAAMVARCPTTVAYSEALDASFTLVDAYGNTVCEDKPVSISVASATSRLGARDVVCSAHAGSRQECEARGCLFSTPQVAAAGACVCASAACCCESPNAPNFAAVAAGTTAADALKHRGQFSFCPAGESAVLYQSNVGGWAAAGSCFDETAAVFEMDNWVAATVTTDGALTLKAAGDGRFANPDLALQVAGPFRTAEHATFENTMVEKPQGRVHACASGAAASVDLSVSRGDIYLIRVSAKGTAASWSKSGVFFLLSQKGTGAFGCATPTAEDGAQALSRCGRAAFPAATLEYTPGRGYPERCTEAPTNVTARHGTLQATCGVATTCRALGLRVWSLHARNANLGEDLIRRGEHMEVAHQEVLVTAEGIAADERAQLLLEVRELCTPARALLAAWGTTTEVALAKQAVVTLSGTPPQGSVDWTYSGTCQYLSVRVSSPGMLPAERMVRVLGMDPAALQIFDAPTKVAAGNALTVGVRLVDAGGVPTTDHTAACTARLLMPAEEGTWVALGDAVLTQTTTAAVAYFATDITAAGRVRVSVSCVLKTCPGCASQTLVASTDATVVPGVVAGVRCTTPASVAAMQRISLTAVLHDAHGNPTEASGARLLAGTRGQLDGSLVGESQATAGKGGVAIWKDLRYSRVSSLPLYVTLSGSTGQALVGCYMDVGDYPARPHLNSFLTSSLSGTALFDLTPARCAARCVAEGLPHFAIGPLAPGAKSVGCWCVQQVFQSRFAPVSHRLCSGVCAGGGSSLCGGQEGRKRFVAVYRVAVPEVFAAPCRAISVTVGTPYRVVLVREPCGEAAGASLVSACLQGLAMGEGSRCKQALVGQTLTYSYEVVDEGGNPADVVGGSSECVPGFRDKQFCETDATTKLLKCTVQKMIDVGCARRDYKAVGLVTVVGKANAFSQQEPLWTGKSTFTVAAAYTHASCMSVQAAAPGLQPSAPSATLCFHSGPATVLQLEAPRAVSYDVVAPPVTVTLLDVHGNVAELEADSRVHLALCPDSACATELPYGLTGQTQKRFTRGRLVESALKVQKDARATTSTTQEVRYIKATLVRESGALLGCAGSAAQKLGAASPVAVQAISGEVAVAPWHLSVSAPVAPVAAGVLYDVTALVRNGTGACNVKGSTCPAAVRMQMDESESSLGGQTRVAYSTYDTAAGKAVFTGLSTPVAGRYSLRVWGTASDGTLTHLLPVATAVIVIVPGAASQLVFRDPLCDGPASVEAGKQFSLSMEIQDRFGNAAAGWTHPIRLLLCRRSIEPVPCDLWDEAAPEGIPSASSATVRFTGLNIDRVHDLGYQIVARSTEAGARELEVLPSVMHYTLKYRLDRDLAASIASYVPKQPELASGLALSQAVCGHLSVTPAAPAQLRVTTEPSEVRADATFSVAAEIVDVHGNRVPRTLDGVAVTASVTTGSQGLRGVRSSVIGAGAAVLDSLAYARPETVLLTVSLEGVGVSLPPASLYVRVLQGAACCLHIVSPSAVIGDIETLASPLRAGDEFDVLVEVQDRLGNRVESTEYRRKTCTGRTAVADGTTLYPTYPQDLPDDLSKLVESYKHDGSFTKELADARLAWVEEDPDPEEKTCADEEFERDATPLEVSLVIGWHTRACPSGQACSGLHGNVRQTVRDGRAEFKGISHERSECFRIEAVGGGLTAAQSPMICIQPNSLSQIVCTFEQTHASADVPMGMIRGRLLDRYGNAAANCPGCSSVRVEESASSGGSLAVVEQHADQFGTVSFTGLTFPEERGAANLLRTRLVGAGGITAECDIGKGLRVTKDLTLSCLGVQDFVVAGQPFAVSAELLKWDDVVDRYVPACPVHASCSTLVGTTNVASGYPNSAEVLAWAADAATATAKATAANGILQFTVPPLHRVGVARLRVTADDDSAAEAYCEPLRVVAAPAAKLGLSCPTAVRAGSSATVFAFVSDAYGNPASTFQTASTTITCSVNFGGVTVRSFTDEWSEFFVTTLPLAQEPLVLTKAGNYKVTCQMVSAGTTLNSSCPLKVHEGEAVGATCQAGQASVQAGEEFTITGSTSDVFGNTVAVGWSGAETTLSVGSGSQTVNKEKTVVSGSVRFRVNYEVAERVVFTLRIGRFQVDCPHVTVTPGALRVLRVQAQPRCPTALPVNKPFSDVVVHAYDSHGNMVAEASETVHVLAEGVVLLGGPTSTSLRNGAATFHRLSYGVASREVRLRFSTAAGVHVVSDPLCFASEDPPQISVVMSPRTFELNQVMRSVQVGVHDATGNELLLPSGCQASLRIKTLQATGLSWEEQTCTFLASEADCNAAGCFFEKNTEADRCKDPAVARVSPGRRFGFAYFRDAAYPAVGDEVEYFGQDEPRMVKVTAMTPVTTPTEATTYNVHDVANPAVTWTALPSAAVKRLDIFMFGGSGAFPSMNDANPFVTASAGAVSNDLWHYRIRSRHWSKMTYATTTNCFIGAATSLTCEVPPARFGHVAATYGTATLIYGGKKADNRVHGTDLYVITIPAGATRTASSVKRTTTGGPKLFGAAASVYGRSLFLFGGASDDAVSGDLWRLDLTQLENVAVPLAWTKVDVSGGPAGMYFAPAVLSGENLYVLPGFLANGKAAQGMWSLSLKNLQAWETLSSKVPAGSIVAYDPYGKTIFSYGGSASVFDVQSLSPAVSAFSVARREWVVESERLPSALNSLRSSHSAVPGGRFMAATGASVVALHTAYLYGGWDAQATPGWSEVSENTAEKVFALSLYTRPVAQLSATRGATEFGGNDVVGVLGVKLTGHLDRHVSGSNILFDGVTVRGDPAIDKLTVQLSVNLACPAQRELLLDLPPVAGLRCQIQWNGTFPVRAVAAGTGFPTASSNGAITVAMTAGGNPLSASVMNQVMEYGVQMRVVRTLPAGAASLTVVKVVAVYKAVLPGHMTETLFATFEAGAFKSTVAPATVWVRVEHLAVGGVNEACSDSPELSFNIVPAAACDVAFGDTAATIAAGEAFAVPVSLYDEYANPAMCGTQRDAYRAASRETLLLQTLAVSTAEECETQCTILLACMMWNHRNGLCSLYDSVGQPEVVSERGSVTGLFGALGCPDYELLLNPVSRAYAPGLQVVSELEGHTYSDAAFSLEGCYVGSAALWSIVKASRAYRTVEECAACCREAGATRILAAAAAEDGLLRCVCAPSSFALAAHAPAPCGADRVAVHSLHGRIAAMVTGSRLTFKGMWHNREERVSLEAVLLGKPDGSPGKRTYSAEITVTYGEPHHLVSTMKPGSISAPDCTLEGKRVFSFTVVDFWGNRHYEALHRVSLILSEGSGRLSGRTSVVTRQGLAEFAVGYNRAGFVQLAAVDLDLLPKSCRESHLGCVRREPSPALSGDACAARCEGLHCQRPSPPEGVAYTPRFAFLTGPPAKLVVTRQPPSEVLSSQEVSFAVRVHDVCGNNVTEATIGLFDKRCLTGTLAVRPVSADALVGRWELLAPATLADGAATVRVKVSKAGPVQFEVQLGGCAVLPAVSQQVTVSPSAACCVRIAAPIDCAAVTLPSPTINVHGLLPAIRVEVVDEDGNTVTNDKRVRAVVGCYFATKTDPLVNIPLDTVTLDTCMERCYALGYSVMAVEAGRLCYCGDETFVGAAPLPVTECMMQCAGANDNAWCGGIGARQVYKIVSGHQVTVAASVGSLIGGPSAVTEQGVAYLDNVRWAPPSKLTAACAADPSLADCTPTVQLDVESFGLLSTTCEVEMKHLEVKCSGAPTVVRVGDAFDLQAQVWNGAVPYASAATLKIVDATLKTLTSATGELTDTLGNATITETAIAGGKAVFKGLTYATKLAPGEAFALRTFYVAYASASQCVVQVKVLPGRVSTCAVAGPVSAWNLAGEPFSVQVVASDARGNPAGDDPRCLQVSRVCPVGAEFVTSRSADEEKELFEDHAVTRIRIHVGVRDRKGARTMYSSDLYPMVTGAYTAWETPPTGAQIEGLASGAMCAVLRKEMRLTAGVVKPFIHWHVVSAGCAGIPQLCSSPAPCTAGSEKASGTRVTVTAQQAHLLKGTTTADVVGGRGTAAGLRYQGADSNAEFQYQMRSARGDILCEGPFQRFVAPNMPAELRVDMWTALPQDAIAGHSGLAVCRSCSGSDNFGDVAVGDFSVRVAAYDALGNEASWAHPEQAWTPDQYVGAVTLRVKNGDGEISTVQRAGLTRHLQSGSVTFSGLTARRAQKLVIEAVAPDWDASQKTAYVPPSATLTAVACFPTKLTVRAPTAAVAGVAFTVWVHGWDEQGAPTDDLAVNVLLSVGALAAPSGTVTLTQTGRGVFSVMTQVAGPLVLTPSATHTKPDLCSTTPVAAAATVLVEHAEPFQLVVPDETSGVTIVTDIPSTNGVKVYSVDKYNNRVTNREKYRQRCTLDGTGTGLGQFNLLTKGVTPLVSGANFLRTPSEQPTLLMHSEQTRDGAAQAGEAGAVWFRYFTIPTEVTPASPLVTPTPTLATMTELGVTCTRTTPSADASIPVEMKATVNVNITSVQQLYVARQVVLTDTNAVAPSNCPLRVNYRLQYTIRALTAGGGGLQAWLFAGNDKFVTAVVQYEDGAVVQVPCASFIQRSTETLSRDEIVCSVDVAKSVKAIMFQETSHIATPMLGSVFAGNMPIKVVSGCPAKATSTITHTAGVTHPVRKAFMLTVELKDAAGNLVSNGVVVDLTIASQATPSNSDVLLSKVTRVPGLRLRGEPGVPSAASVNGVAVFTELTATQPSLLLITATTRAFQDPCAAACTAGTEMDSVTVLFTSGAPARCVVDGFPQSMMAGQSQPTTLRLKLLDEHGFGVVDLPRGVRVGVRQTAGAGFLAKAMEKSRKPASRRFPASMVMRREGSEQCSKSTLLPPSTFCIMGLAPGTALPRAMNNEFTLEMWAKFSSLRPVSLTSADEEILMYNTQFKWYVKWSGTTGAPAANTPRQGKHIMVLEVPAGTVVASGELKPELLDAWHGYSAVFTGATKVPTAVTPERAHLRVDGTRFSTDVAYTTDLSAAPSKAPLLEMRLTTTLVYDIRIFSTHFKKARQFAANPPGADAGETVPSPTMQLRVTTEGLDTGSTGSLKVWPDGSIFEPTGNVPLSPDTPDSAPFGAFDALYSRQNCTVADPNGYNCVARGLVAAHEIPDVWYSSAPDVLGLECSVQHADLGGVRALPVTIKTRPGVPHSQVCAEEAIVGLAGAPFRSSVWLTDEADNVVPCSTELSGATTCRDLVAQIHLDGYANDTFFPTTTASYYTEHPKQAGSSFEVSAATFVVTYVPPVAAALTNGGGEAQAADIRSSNGTVPIATFGVDGSVGEEGWDASVEGRNVDASFHGSWLAASRHKGLSFAGSPVTAVEGLVYFYSQLSVGVSGERTTSMRYTARAGSLVALKQYLVSARVTYVNNEDGRNTEDRGELEVRYTDDKDNTLLRVVGETSVRPNYPTWGWLTVQHQVPRGSAKLFITVRCLKIDRVSAGASVADCRVAFDDVSLRPVDDESLLLRYTTDVKRADGTVIPAATCGPTKLIPQPKKCPDGNREMCDDGSLPCYPCATPCVSGVPKCLGTVHCEPEECSFHGVCRRIPASDPRMAALRKFDQACSERARLQCCGDDLSDVADADFTARCGKQFCALVPSQCTCFSDETNGFWTGTFCDRCQHGYQLPDCKVRVCQVDANGNVCSGHGECGDDGQCTCYNEEMRRQQDAADSAEAKDALYFNSSSFMRAALSSNFPDGTPRRTSVSVSLFQNCTHVLHAFADANLGIPDDGLYSIDPFCKGFLCNAGHCLCTVPSGVVQPVFCRYFADHKTGSLVASELLGGVWGGVMEPALAVLKMRKDVAPLRELAAKTRDRFGPNGEEVGGMWNRLSNTDGSVEGGAFWAKPLGFPGGAKFVVLSSTDGSQWVALSKALLASALQGSAKSVVVPVEYARTTEVNSDSVCVYKHSATAIGVFASCNTAVPVAQWHLWFGEGDFDTSLRYVSRTARVYLAEVFTNTTHTFRKWNTVEDLPRVVSLRALVPDQLSYRVSECCADTVPWREYRPRTWPAIREETLKQPRYGAGVSISAAYGETVEMPAPTADIVAFQVLLVADAEAKMNVKMHLEYADGVHSAAVTGTPIPRTSFSTTAAGTTALIYTPSETPPLLQVPTFDVSGITAAKVCAHALSGARLRHTPHAQIDRCVA